jgi:hypothetical protein
MVRDYFDGVVTKDDANAVRKLFAKVIENLTAQGNSTAELADGELIAATLLSQYDIDIPVDYAVDYFNGYAQKHLFDFFAGSGNLNVDDSGTERLMVKIIMNLLITHTVDDLTDGSRISAAMMRDYNITVTSDYTRAFYGKWVETVRNESKR